MSDTRGTSDGSATSDRRATGGEAGVDATGGARASDSRKPDAPALSSADSASIRQQTGGRGPMAGAGAPVQKALQFWPSARRLLGRLRPDRTAVVGVALLGVASVLLSVIGPRILGNATDVIVDGIAGGDGVDFAALARLLVVVLGIYVLSSFFSWWQSFVLNGVTQRTVFRLRNDVEGKINRLPLSYFDRVQRGELLSRVTNDIDNVSQSLQQTLSQVLTSLLTVVGVIAFMLTISPLLTVIALVTVPLTYLVVTLIAKRSQRLFIDQWRLTGQLNGTIEETFSGHALVKVFGRQHEIEQEFAEKNQQLYTASFGAQFVSGIITPALMFVGNLVYVAVAVVGGILVTGGSITIGAVQAFIQYSRQFSQPLSQLGAMANTLQSGVASSERVFQLLDADEQSPDPVPAASPSSDAGRIEFRGVGFRYEKDTPLIDDLSLVAEPGQTVAIVGPTGAGKTTLVNLLMRFYELDAGAILIDGVDTASMRRSDLRSRMGMVLQDTWLFAGTIRDNIAYGRPDASEDDILEAARATYVDRFVHSLPDGYDTLLEDGGANVSAGEKQLLTIARAFLARPDVLILDEATSSVDTRTEVLVQQAMTALRADRTSFVIAHRLSTIRDADTIVVMDAGRIVEQGTHASLLERGGAYSRLYEAQFATAD